MILAFRIIFKQLNLIIFFEKISNRLLKAISKWYYTKHINKNFKCVVLVKYENTNQISDFYFGRFFHVVCSSEVITQNIPFLSEIQFMGNYISNHA